MGYFKGKMIVLFNRLDLKIYFLIFFWWLYEFKFVLCEKCYILVMFLYLKSDIWLVYNVCWYFESFSEILENGIVMIDLYDVGIDVLDLL